MKLSVFCLLLVMVVVPPWLALNCSFLHGPPDPHPDSTSPKQPPLINKNPPKNHAPKRASKYTAENTRYKATAGYMWVRDLDMVVTTSGYVWHNDLHKKEVIVGGGTVEMPVRVDRAGVAKGLLLAKTKAKLECTSRVNETMIFIYIWHSENMGNLHEGLFAIYMALKETGHLDDPIRLGFVERWGPNNQDFINLAYPTAVQPSILLGEIAEDHVVDFKSSIPPDVIDGLCVRELLVIKDQFPIFPPPSKRSLIGYRKYLFATFKVHAPVEHATRLEEAFHIPAVATDEAPPRSPAAKPRVVLLRRTKDKRVLNDDELVKALRAELGDSADVVQVVPDLLSVDEMIKLMQSTTVLIGVHGSGLGQLWFLPRTSSMIVLHPPGTEDLLSRTGLETGAPWLVDYLSLAQKMSLNAYVYQEKKVTEFPEEQDCGEGRWGLYCSYVRDFEVTTDELVALVRQAFDASLARKDETFD